jgi:hypothetical protein
MTGMSSQSNQKVVMVNVSGLILGALLSKKYIAAGAGQRRSKLLLIARTPGSDDTGIDQYILDIRLIPPEASDPPMRFEL